MLKDPINGLIERFGLGSNLGFDSGLATARASPACTVPAISLLELGRRQSPRHRRRSRLPLFISFVSKLATRTGPVAIARFARLLSVSCTLEQDTTADRHRHRYHLPSLSPPLPHSHGSAPRVRVSGVRVSGMGR